MVWRGVSALLLLFGWNIGQKCCCCVCVFLSCYLEMVCHTSSNFYHIVADDEKSAERLWYPLYIQSWQMLLVWDNNNDYKY